MTFRLSDRQKGDSIKDTLDVTQWFFRACVWCRISFGIGLKKPAAKATDCGPRRVDRARLSYRRSIHGGKGAVDETPDNFGDRQDGHSRRPPRIQPVVRSLWAG